jgi:flavin-dependent dehydrogenase
MPDVVVVGGGPIGLATAIAARMRGLEVLLADRDHPPIDKACGEGVMPEGVAVLAKLGVTVSDRARPFHGIRFCEAGLSAEARFPAGYGLGIRRPILHQLLVDRAAEAGVLMCWGERVSAVGRGRVEIGGRSVACRWVVGADGLESRVREWAGFRPPSGGRRRIGMRQRFRASPWTDLVEVHWHQSCQAYVTPVAANEVCVAVVASKPAGRLPQLVRLFPELCRRLDGAEPASSVRGGTSVSSRMRSVAGNGFALVGDASGSVDAVTGEGLALGFRQAIALAEALERNDLAQYQLVHRRISRPPRLMAGLLLFVGDRTWLRRRVLRALASQSEIFDLMLSVHIGALSLGAIRLGALAGFARSLFAGAPFDNGNLA